MQIVAVFMQEPIYLHDLSLQVRKHGALKYAPNFTCSKRKDHLITLEKNQVKMPLNKILCAVRIDAPKNMFLHGKAVRELSLSFFMSLNGTTLKRLHHFQFKCRVANITKAIDDHYRLLLKGYSGNLGIKGLSINNEY